MTDRPGIIAALISNAFATAERWLRHAQCSVRHSKNAFEIDRLSAAVSSGFARGKVRKAPTSNETKEKKTH